MDKSPEQTETELEDDYFADCWNDPDYLKLMEFYRTHPGSFAAARRRFVDQDPSDFVIIKKEDRSS